jgi:hypothetical protein
MHRHLLPHDAIRENPLLLWVDYFRKPYEKSCSGVARHLNLSIKLYAKGIYQTQSQAFGILDIQVLRKTYAIVLHQKLKFTVATPG